MLTKLAYIEDAAYWSHYDNTGIDLPQPPPPPVFMVSSGIGPKFVVTGTSYVTKMAAKLQMPNPRVEIT